MVRDDFIGIFDNVLTPAECGELIDYFVKMRKLNLVYKRPDAPHEKKDETVYPFEPDSLHFVGTNPVVQSIMEKVWKCYNEYCDNFSILTLKNEQGVTGMRVQRTQPGGGYHQWHYENQGIMHSNRFLVFQIYLNTVTEGGETEFLYQKTRVNAQQGRVLLWPAAFTHTHRGNQPLSGDKYIVTGWIEYLN
jgi:hypothetical protein